MMIECSDVGDYAVWGRISKRREETENGPNPPVTAILLITPALDPPRLVYWFVIAGASLTVFASIANTSTDSNMKGYTIAAGAVSFGLAMFAIFVHYIGDLSNLILKGQAAPVSEVR